MVIVAVVAVLLPVTPPTHAAAPQVVTIESVGLTWDPNASACRTSSLNSTLVDPSLPYTTTVRAGFNVSFQMICATNAGAPPTSYLIDNAAPTSSGVSVVGSNMPVRVSSVYWSTYTVTLMLTGSAPSTNLTIQAAAESVPASNP